LYNISLTGYNCLLLLFRVATLSEVSVDVQSIGISPGVIRTRPGGGIGECWQGQVSIGGGLGVQH
jgi:hypothetical protein